MKMLTQSLSIAVLFLFLSPAFAQGNQEDQPNTENKNPQTDSADQESKQLAVNPAIYKKAGQQITAAAKQDDWKKMRDEAVAASELLPKDSYPASRVRALVATLDKTEDKSNRSFQPLREKLLGIGQELEFQPKIQTKLPQGFPGITPVGEIQVKSYPAYRTAQTEIMKEDDSAESGAFGKLFQHIQTNEFEMTAPVEKTYLVGDKGLEETKMGFLYSSPKMGKTGDQDEVNVVDVAAAKVISMGIVGKLTPERIANARTELVQRAQVLAPNHSLVDGVRVLAYNGPSVAEKNQYYEIQCELVKADSLK